MKILIKLFFVLFISFGANAQLSNPIYTDGDKVAFVGNSITRNSEFYAIISLYQATRFPHQRVRFYNCGVSGDNTLDVLKRYNSDVMYYSPNKVSVMLGMNDVGRNNYDPALMVNGVFPSTVLVSQQSSKTNFANNITQLILKFKASGCQVVIQSPTIYDELVNLPSVTALKCNSALTELAVMCKDLATDNSYSFVDYNKELNRIDGLEKAVLPTFSFTPTDRVHPETLGHFTMAYYYLKSLGMPSLVSNVELNAGTSVPDKSENATVSGVNLTTSGGTFKVHAYALPMPFITGSEKALSWSYFDYYNDLNREILKVSGLNQSQTYGLIIGGIVVDNFTGAQFEAGINLAKFSTPQSMQSEKIRQLIYKKRAMEHKIRQFRLMEKVLTQSEMETMTLEQIMSAVASRSTASITDKANYAADRQNEPDYRIQISTIEEEIVALQSTKALIYSIGATVTVTDYNKSDLNQLVSFLMQPSTEAGKTNADVLGITNLQDPSTWPYSGTSNNSSTAWVWNTSSPKTLARIHLNNIADASAKSKLSGDLFISPASGNLAGINLTGCNNINSFVLSGTSSGPYTAVFDGCSSLRKIDLGSKTSNFSFLTINNCIALRELILNSSAFTASNTTCNITISNNPKLSQMNKVNVSLSTTQTAKTLFPNCFVRIKNNALLYSKLPNIVQMRTQLTTADTLAFNTDNAFILDKWFNNTVNKHELTTEDEIDLSKEVAIKLQPTSTSNASTFQWYSSLTDSPVYPEIIAPGKFKLKGSGFTIGESYYVKIQNVTFSTFGLTEIKSMPFQLKSLTSTNVVTSKSVNIYPNPFSDVLQIQTEFQDYMIEIFNIAGQKIGVYNNVNTINTTELQPGVYVLKLTSAIGVYQRIIVRN
jgi:lysophospholipase L1-like esterase